MSYFRCPHCKKYTETKVTNGRKAKTMNGFRRRRECIGCGERYTTVEVIVAGKKGDTRHLKENLHEEINHGDNLCS